MKKPAKAPKAIAPETLAASMQPRQVSFRGTMLYRRRDLPQVMPWLGRTVISELIRKGLFIEPVVLPNGIKAYPDFALQAWIVEQCEKSEQRRIEHDARRAARREARAAASKGEHE